MMRLMNNMDRPIRITMGSYIHREYCHNDHTTAIICDHSPE